MKRWLPGGPGGLFLLCLAGQISVLPDTLDGGLVVRILNALVLLVFLMVTARTLTSSHHPSVWVLYLLPVLLIFSGVGLNIVRALGPSSLGAAGQLLAWSAALSVPFMRGYSVESAWLVFYRFMYVFSLVALAEYFAIFDGRLELELIPTERGEFLKGVVTILFPLVDGSPHERMYGIFPEPGTYAMLLIPAIVYAFLRKRWLAVVVFGACMFYTASLGGVVGIAVTGVVFFLRGRRHVMVRLVVAGVLLAVGWSMTSEYFLTSYEDKRASATVRERNIFGFIQDMPRQLTQYPLGARLDTGRSLSADGDFEEGFLGLNFSPYIMLILGGVLALIGYLAMMTVIVSQCLKELQRGMVRQPVAVVSAFLTIPAMVLFSLQRQTVFETTLLAFLFAWPVLNSIRRGNDVALEAPNA